MRIFLAGASGVIGVRLVPLLTAAGHEVAGMTRSQEKVDALTELGAEPVVCDVYDASSLIEAVTAFRLDLVMHQLAARRTLPLLDAASGVVIITEEDGPR